MKYFTTLKNIPQKVYVLVAAVAFGVVGVILLAASHASGSGTLSLTPATGNLSLGANVQVTIVENSGSIPANAVEADLTYDQTKLQFVSIDSSTGPFNLAASSVGGGGTVNIGIGTSTPVTGQQTVAVVTFTAIGTGSTAINFAASSGLAQASDSTDILGTMTGATYTIADTTAPSVPAGITSATQTATAISLSWTASTDNVGVTVYKVFRAGTQIGTTATNSYTDTGLTAGTSYAYTISAGDAAGNTSAQSGSSSFKTLAVPGDANGDGHVTYLDLSIMAGSWQKTTDLRADFNYDGIVNFLDLSILASNWGK